MNDALRLAGPLAILAAALLPAITYPGDEDAKPAYMIYINPETGKYTTEDPEAGNTNDSVVPARPASGNTNDSVVPARPASGNSQPNLTVLIVGGSALAVLLVGGLLKRQRRQIT
ncbi:MAG: hypothetical protein IIA11_00955 [Proteobacteria bacterium]|nr:hypothetical protein [Pseudomonadota bacterium]